MHQIKFFSFLNFNSSVNFWKYTCHVLKHELGDDYSVCSSPPLSPPFPQDSIWNRTFTCWKVQNHNIQWQQVSLINFCTNSVYCEILNKTEATLCPLYSGIQIFSLISKRSALCPACSHSAEQASVSVFLFWVPSSELPNCSGWERKSLAVSKGWWSKENFLFDIFYLGIWLFQNVVINIQINVLQSPESLLNHSLFCNILMWCALTDSQNSDWGILLWI